MRQRLLIWTAFAVALIALAVKFQQTWNAEPISKVFDGKTDLPIRLIGTSKLENFEAFFQVDDRVEKKTVDEILAIEDRQYRIARIGSNDVLLNRGFRQYVLSMTLDNHSNQEKSDDEGATIRAAEASSSQEITKEEFLEALFGVYQFETSFIKLLSLTLEDDRTQSGRRALRLQYDLNILPVELPLLDGDKIVSVNGTPVSELGQILRNLDENGRGTQVSIEIEREKRLMMAKVNFKL